MKTSKVNKVFKFWLLALSLCVAMNVATVVRAQNNTFNPGASSITPSTQQIEIGPVLDVVPYVLSDGYTINLTLIPSLVQFDGYASAPSFASTVTGNTATIVQLPVALPDFSVRQIVTTVNIWDNQTVVLGGLISSSTGSTKDKVPMLGDLPLVGRLFQSQSKTTTKQNLMIFVTATIIDPAGNRVHSDDELPFAQAGVPIQPPGAGQMTETVETMTTPPLK